MTIPTLESGNTYTNDPSTRYDRWMYAGYYAPDFAERISQQLDRLALLPPNWDHEGAPSIDSSILQAARQFVERLPEGIASVPVAVPSASGNLQFEWTEDNRSLELEIETPTTIHYLKWCPDEGIEEEDVFNIGDLDRAVVLIQWFMRGATNV